MLPHLLPQRSCSVHPAFAVKLGTRRPPRRIPRPLVPGQPSATDRELRIREKAPTLRLHGTGLDRNVKPFEFPEFNEAVARLIHVDEHLGCPQRAVARHEPLEAARFVSNRGSVVIDLDHLSRPVVFLLNSFGFSHFRHTNRPPALSTKPSPLRQIAAISCESRRTSRS